MKVFKSFEGVPETVLHDNMKTAWLYYENKWQPHNRLLEIASVYGFTPKRCAVRWPQTKGKVERFIGYLETNVLSKARLENQSSIEELNDAIILWSRNLGDKELRDFKETRNERFSTESRYLNPLPEPLSLDPIDNHELIVNREGTITFRTNKYSLPVKLIGKTVTLKIDSFKDMGEVFYENNSIRSFNLMPAGACRKDILPDDGKELYIV